MLAKILFTKRGIQAIFLSFFPHVNVFIFIQNRIMTWLRVSWHDLSNNSSFFSLLFFMGKCPLIVELGFLLIFYWTAARRNKWEESSRAQKLTQCLDSFVICHLHYYGSPGNAVLSPWLFGSPLLMQSITKVFPLIVKHSSRISCLDRAWTLKAIPSLLMLLVW